MILIDTSVWIRVLGDQQGDYARDLRREIAGQEMVLTRFQQLELLQGCRDEQQWNRLHDYLEGQDYVETCAATWPEAARIYFLLRKRGLTVRSPIDCCIAQLAIEHHALLIHDDRDFDVIGQHFPLQHRRWRAPGS